MKKLTLILFLFFGSLLCHVGGGDAFAQQQGQGLVDSLLTHLPEAGEDTNKVQLLNRLAFAYQSISPDEGLKCAEQALTLAGKLNWTKGIAIATEMKGINYFNKSDYSQALDCYEKALKIANDNNYVSGIAEITGRFGAVYTEESVYDKALEKDLYALQMDEELGNKKAKADVLWDMGNIYEYKKDFPKAMDYFNQSLQLDEKLNNKEGEANNLNDIGWTFFDLKNDTSKSVEYFTKALAINKKYGYKRGIARNQFGMVILYGESRNDYVTAIDYSLKSLKVAEELGYKRLIVWNLGNIGEYYMRIAKDRTGRIYPDSLHDKNKLLDRANQYINRSIEVAKSQKGEINAVAYYYGDLSDAEKEAGNYKDALESYVQHKFYNDSSQSFASSRKIALMEDKQAMELQTAEIKRQKIIRNSVIGGLTIMIFFSIIVSRQRYRIAKQRNRIKEEKKRSDELLLNILPEETAEELKQTGTAKARSYDLVSVMFTDFKNFTQASEKMTAEELVMEINRCYSRFDKIITKHGIEKIKTIGDSYMCAGGLPVENKTNPHEVVNAALDILKFIEKEKTERQKNNVPYFEIRIGIHTGPVVAGIVGIKKFAYDIWGDTVNIASRMESSGQVGKLNISGTTYELVKEKFVCTHRGKVDAKNKGMIDMYFVEGGEIMNTPK